MPDLVGAHTTTPVYINPSHLIFPTPPSVRLSTPATATISATYYARCTALLAVQEDATDTPGKRKPRLLQSQGGVCSAFAAALGLKTSAKPQLDVNPREISSREYKRAARTLQLAFSDDPFVNYILSTPVAVPAGDERAAKRKNDLMLAFFEYSVYECFAMGGIVVALVDDRLERDIAELNMKPAAINKVPFLGVACWFNLVYNNNTALYGYSSPSAFSVLHSLSLKFNLFALLANVRLKILKDKLPQLSSVRDVALNSLKLNPRRDSVWYLGDIGILPTMQGRGLARTLFDHCVNTYVNTSPDSWCYLESSNPINRKFYHKLGFQVLNTFSVNDDAVDEDDEVRLDAMVKRPVAVSHGSIFRRRAASFPNA